MTHLDVSTAPVSHLAVAPPAVAEHQSADWGLVQAEQVDIIRHEPFSYEFKGPPTSADRVRTRRALRR